MTRLHHLSIASLACLLPTLFLPSIARACGCFAPPDPTVNVLQSGERIVFSVDNAGTVTAHIQIQYTGGTNDFGWLLPVSSVPTLELGTDELFALLQAETQPTWTTNLDVAGNCVAFPDLGAFEPGDLGASLGGSDPLVVMDSIGPYDYAVLKADDETAMLAWLSANHYFVPAGTPGAITPYIHPGAFFLALRLHPSESAGSIQPIVVHYASGLPMIPITLTSATASAQLRVWVWVMGQGRSIPRNYYGSVIDDAAIDWLGGGDNYEQVVAQAVTEAPGHHTFVTEYAGTSKIVAGQLDYAGRFGSQSALAGITDFAQYIAYLKQYGFPTTAQLFATLASYVAEPPALVTEGISYAQFAWNISVYRANQPQAFTGVSLAFDPVALTNDLWTRIVTPDLAAGQLLSSQPYLTRLHTILAPADMNSDPVFSFNPSLPDVALAHVAHGGEACFGWGGVENVTITSPEGFTWNALEFAPGLPATLLLETFLDTGAPQIVTDNSPEIAKLLAAEAPPLLDGGTSGFDADDGNPFGYDASISDPGNPSIDGGAVAAGDDAGAGVGSDGGVQFELGRTGCNVASGANHDGGRSELAFFLALLGLARLRRARRATVRRR